MELSTLPSSAPTTGTGDYSLPVSSNTSLTLSSEQLTDAIPHLVEGIMPTLMLVAGSLALFYILYAGILYITAGGDANRVKTARATILNAMIGIVVILSSFTIIRMAVSAGTEIGSLGL